jgi:hypothetical protein
MIATKAMTGFAVTKWPGWDGTVLQDAQERVQDP